MNSGTARIATVLISLVLTLSACPQQAVAPPPKPADGGPSLAVTLTFIQDKLNGPGTMNFIDFGQNTSDGVNYTHVFIYKVDDVIADPVACRIGCEWTITRDGKQLQDHAHVDIDLREVQDRTVLPWEQVISRVNSMAGTPNKIATSTQPPVTGIVIRKTGNVSNYLPLLDASLADRVAKAMTHAVELCGARILSS